MMVMWCFCNVDLMMVASVWFSFWRWSVGWWWGGFPMWRWCGAVHVVLFVWCCCWRLINIVVLMWCWCCVYVLLIEWYCSVDVACVVVLYMVLPLMYWYGGLFCCWCDFDVVLCWCDDNADEMIMVIRWCAGVAVAVSDGVVDGKQLMFTVLTRHVILTRTFPCGLRGGYAARPSAGGRPFWICCCWNQSA